MLWPAITEETLNELARNFSDPLPVHEDCETALGLKESESTGCKVTKVEVKRDEQGAYLAGLLVAPMHLVERPMSWSYLHNGPNGAKLVALYFGTDPIPAGAQFVDASKE